MKYLVLASAICLPLLTGCVVAVNNDDKSKSTSSWEQTYAKNRKAIANMQISEDYQTVINKLGTPNFSELVNLDNNEYRVLYYATNSMHSDSKVTKDECTPLVFKDQKLTGVGDLRLNQVKKVETKNGRYNRPF